MNQIIAALRAKWEHFDAKMKYQLLSGMASYAVLKLGVHIDPVLEGFIAIAIGGIVGYRVPNAASALREARGGAVDPEDVEIPNATGLELADPLEGIDPKALAAREAHKPAPAKRRISRVREGGEFPPLK